MKIEAVDLWQIRSPLHKPYHLSRFYGTLTHAEAVFVRVRTDDGIEGWGEADPLRPFTSENAAGVFAFLGEVVPRALLGRDPADHAALLEELAQAAPGYPTARGALDMALHDIVARSAGVSVATLLGGPVRKSIPLLWPLGSESLDESSAIVEARAAQGYRTFMIKTGSRDVAEDAARTLGLIERFPELSFQADANQGWSESEALRYVALIGAAPLILLEQPVPRIRPEALKRVREQALMPVSADEGVFSPEEAARLAAGRIVDAFSIKPSKNAGLGPSRKIASLAEAFGMPILMNSMIEFGVTQAASLQLGLTLTNLMDCGHAYMSTLRLHGDPTSFSALVERAVAYAPEAPGLGVTVDTEALARLAAAHRSLRLGDPATGASAS
ncbi:MAG: enolase C-terminal domain-like protein [Burkholderiaceae bacterium]